jgi:hypothetical protein
MIRLFSLLTALVVLAGCGSADELAVAAAGAVGGCALLDTDDDDEVSSEEAAYGLFDLYDEDEDGVVTRAEFRVGVARSPSTADFGGSFDDWDANNDGALTRPEFVDGAVGSDGIVDVADSSCDEIGL